MWTGFGAKPLRVLKRVSPGRHFPCVRACVFVRACVCVRGRETDEAISRNIAADTGSQQQRRQHKHSSGVWTPSCGGDVDPESRLVSDLRFLFVAKTRLRDSRACVFLVETQPVSSAADTSTCRPLPSSPSPLRSATSPGRTEKTPATPRVLFSHRALVSVGVQTRKELLPRFAVGLCLHREGKSQNNTCGTGDTVRTLFHEEDRRSPPSEPRDPTASAAPSEAEQHRARRSWPCFLLRKPARVPVHGIPRTVTERAP